MFHCTVFVLCLVVAVSSLSLCLYLYVCLSVKVDSLCQCFQYVSFRRLNKEFFIFKERTEKKKLINHSSFFHLFSINFSLHLEMFGCVSRWDSPMLTMTTTCSMVFFINM